MLNVFQKFTATQKKTEQRFRDGFNFWFCWAQRFSPPISKKRVYLQDVSFNDNLEKLGCGGLNGIDVDDPRIELMHVCFAKNLHLCKISHDACVVNGWAT